MNFESAQALLCPIGDGRVIVIHRETEDHFFKRVGGLLIDTALTAAHVPGARDAGVTTRLFATTPEHDALLDAYARGHDSKAHPGYMLPVLLGEDGKWAHQIPLKEVDSRLSAVKGTPAVLANAAGLQIVLQRLDDLEAAISQVGVNVEELLDRWDSNQRARLRSIVQDLRDVGDLGSCSPLDWDLVHGHRHELTTLHGEFIEEIERLTKRIHHGKDPTDQWRSLDARSAERLRVLTGLVIIVMEALTRWTAVLLLNLPMDEDNETKERQALERVEIVREEASQALQRIPLSRPRNQRIPTIWLQGPVRAHKELKTARANFDLATPPVPPALRALAPRDELQPFPPFAARMELSQHRRNGVESTPYRSNGKLNP